VAQMLWDRGEDKGGARTSDQEAQDTIKHSVPCHVRRGRKPGTTRSERGADAGSRPDPPVLDAGPAFDKRPISESDDQVSVRGRRSVLDGGPQTPPRGRPNCPTENGHGPHSFPRQQRSRSASRRTTFRSTAYVTPCAVPRLPHRHNGARAADDIGRADGRR